MKGKVAVSLASCDSRYVIGIELCPKSTPEA